MQCLRFLDHFLLKVFLIKEKSVFGRKARPPLYHIKGRGRKKRPGAKTASQPKDPSIMLSWPAGEWANRKPGPKRKRKGQRIIKRKGQSIIFESRASKIFFSLFFRSVCSFFRAENKFLFHFLVSPLFFFFINFAFL